LSRSPKASSIRASAGTRIARLELDDVPRHQFGGRDVARVALAHRPHAARQQALQGGQGLFRAVLLPEREHGVDDDDGDHDQRQGVHARGRVEPVCEPRQSRGQPQHPGEEVRELVGQQAKLAGSLDPLDDVRPELAEANPGVRVRQPLGAAAQLLQRIIDGLPEDRHRTSSGTSCPAGAIP
jgi:hypothetical protein